jgi:hypothetical protein
MARDRTLGEIVDGIRAEAGQSLNPALGRQMRETIVRIAARHQARMWADYTWPHLRVDRFLRLEAGERTYSPPDDMQIDQIEEVSVCYGGAWSLLRPGIDDPQYNSINSIEGQRSWPVEYWNISEGEQIEVWPIPSTDGAEILAVPTYSVIGQDPQLREGWLKLRGIRNLRRLVNDDDRADLDDQLIILYSAAEILARQNAPDAGGKLTQASQRLFRLRGNLTKRRNFVLAGGHRSPGRWPRGAIPIPYKP